MRASDDHSPTLCKANASCFEFDVFAWASEGQWAAEGPHLLELSNSLGDGLPAIRHLYALRSLLTLFGAGLVFVVLVHPLRT